ncbi:hypothetical protein BH11PAT2_BH11PAT2_08620 [soil metagenome]
MPAQPAPQQEVRRKVSNLNAVGIITIALILDAFQFLLSLTVIGALFDVFVAMVAWIIFFVWFFLMDIKYLSGKKSMTKILSVFGSLGIEAIPVVDDLPGLTVGVIGVIWSSRKEEAQQKKLVAANDNEPQTEEYQEAA